MSPLCKEFHTPSPMRCSSPLIDSQSPLLLVSSSGSRPQCERTFIPAARQIYRRSFSSNHERFLLMRRQSILITTHET